MSQFRLVLLIAVTLCTSGCFKYPSAGNNQGRTRSGNRGIAYQSYRHNSLYAIVAWHTGSKTPAILMIFRVENLPSGQEPYSSHGYTDEGSFPGLEIKDHSQTATWVQYVDEGETESVVIFGDHHSLDEGRVLIKDALDPQSKAIQLDASIPFLIPQDAPGSAKDDTSDPMNVLFAVQDLAREHDELKDFIQQHEDTIEYVNRARD